MPGTQDVVRRADLQALYDSIQQMIVDAHPTVANRVSKVGGDSMESPLTIETHPTVNWNVISLGNQPGNTPVVILLGVDQPQFNSERFSLSGRFSGNTHNADRCTMAIDVVYGMRGNNVHFSVFAQSNIGNNNISKIACEYNGETRVGIHIHNATGGSNNYPTRWAYQSSQFVGPNSPLPEVVPASEVFNIQPQARGTQQAVFLYDQVDFHGDVIAQDFITQSRVVPHEPDALAKLDNIATWLRQDGSIDYEKHYAHVKRDVLDENGEKIGEEIVGLSIEERVAMMEKMIYEIREEIRGGGVIHLPGSFTLFIALYGSQIVVIIAPCQKFNEGV